MTRSRATNCVTGELSPELREYLIYCGTPVSEIARCSGSTRMYHDLGIYGEVAEIYMEALVDRYHVDMAGFEFRKYFPPEFVGESALTRMLLWLLPFAGDMVRRKGEYQPLTLEMIECAICTKRWSPAEDERLGQSP